MSDLRNSINRIVGNTKRNHAGNQQPYVPAGNGDESGEYADMVSGSNIHYTAPQSVPPPVLKRESRIKELSPKQKRQIGNYLKSRNYNLDDEKERGYLLRQLRWYGGSFGDLSNFTDDELIDIARDFEESFAKTSDELVYYKIGNKWYSSKNTGLLEKQGIKFYTKQEREELEKKQNIKLVENSQSETDKRIQSIMGSQCVVCFGKGYSKEDTEEIYQATVNLTNEYPDLKNYVARIGDRNNLEKFLNATASQQEFTEEQINEAIEKVKSRYYFGLPSEEKIREEAIKSLQNRVSFTRLNNAYAYWNNSGRTMLFMGKMKKKLEGQNEYEFNINFKSSNKKISTYYHEMGHAIDYMIENMYKQKLNSMTDYNSQSELQRKWYEFQQSKRDFINQNYNPENDMMKQFEKKYGRPYSYSRENVELLNELERELNEKGIKKYRVSKYGATNDREFIAECYSAYFTNMNNELANSTVALYRDMYNYLRS